MLVYLNERESLVIAMVRCRQAGVKHGGDSRVVKLISFGIVKRKITHAREADPMPFKIVSISVRSDKLSNFARISILIGRQTSFCDTNFIYHAALIRDIFFKFITK